MGLTAGKLFAVDTSTYGFRSSSGLSQRGMRGTDANISRHGITPSPWATSSEMAAREAARRVPNAAA